MSSGDSSRDAGKSRSDEWSEIQDPNERRKIQNKLAQRRFRDKAKEQKEETDREAENRRRAGSAYTSPGGNEIETRRNLSGLPWGGISMSHVVETGKSKEQNSQRGSRESSVYGNTQQGGSSSSRLGLCLTDRFAWRRPTAWGYLRNISYQRAHPYSR